MKVYHCPVCGAQLNMVGRCTINEFHVTNIELDPTEGEEMDDNG